MLGIEMDNPAFTIEETNDDFCNSVLRRLGDSPNEKHQHLCIVLGAMSQELKDQNLPSTPIAYLGAVCSSLDKLTSEPDTPRHVVDELLTILSLVITRIPIAILKKKREFLSELVLRVLRVPSVAESSVIPGIKCLSQLLVNRDSANWSDVSQLFGVLLGFVTDSRPKVRRQSHLSLHDVLLSFQKSSLLASASEGITSMFERFLLLADGGNANAAEGPKGAQQVLYILDALKECLPLMSLKCKNSILKYFKTLLNLHQPLITRRIMDGLSFLCLQPSSEVSPGALFGLLSLVALSVSTKTSGDGMTFTARLLGVGMNKVYSLNRQICVINLPVVFNKLKAILASKHEEAIFAATDALKSLIHSCIDESVIKQGVDQISLNAKTESRRSSPTIIAKICVTIESFLDFYYTTGWDRVFLVISSMFQKLGNYSSYFMRGTLQKLAVMQKLADENFPFRKQLHECIGSALVAMGPESFLSLLSLNLEAIDSYEANKWLFLILKQYTVGARLSFFTEEILGMIGRVKQKPCELEQVSSRKADALAKSLWSLLPSFCNYPLDTAESFMELVQALCSKLRDEPDICEIICKSLQLLIQQNKNIIHAESNKEFCGEDMIRERGLVHYTQQVATNNLNVLKLSAWNLLVVLSGIFMDSKKDDGGYLQSTIRGIASISDQEVVSRLFRRKMMELLKVTQETSKVDNSMHIDISTNGVSPLVVRVRYLELAVLFLPGLNDKEIDVLYAAVKSVLKDAEGFIQKKAYKVLSIIFRDSDGFISSKSEELFRLMVDNLPSCHFSAKHHRLDCLYFLILQVLKDDTKQRWREFVSSFLSEIILALKEANKKTRNRAYDILVQIGHACGDEERGGCRENLYQFFNMVAGGLAGETPHMISAAVKGLACLAYEFPDLVSSSYNLLPPTFLLLQRKNREIVKANLGLLKVLVVKSQPEGLQMHLKSMVDGLLSSQDNTKNRLKAKAKLLLEMLVRKCGLEAVTAVMPKEHMKLLTNIRKIKGRKERKRSAKAEETRSYLSKASTSRHSMWNHTKVFSDFDDEDSAGSDGDYMNAKTIPRGGASSNSYFKSTASLQWSKIRPKNLPEHFSDQSDDEPLDLLDQQKTRAALKSSEHLKRKRSDDEIEVDSEGRLIIREEGEKRKDKHTDSDYDARSEPDSLMSAKSGTRSQKCRKTVDSGWAYTGNEYASKKAGGDVRRKDKLEPYAYWPLDRKLMSHRPQHRAAARKGMAGVVKLTKKLEGKSASSLLAVKGMKLKKTKKGSKKNL